MPKPLIDDKIVFGFNLREDALKIDPRPIQQVNVFHSYRFDIL